MSVESALLHLADSTAEAVVGVLAQVSGGDVERGAAVVVPGAADPFASIPTPAIACNVLYVDGITGGNVFALSVRAARKLAAAMMGAEPAEGDHELDEIELSAVSEAANQMMAAAAAATSSVLGQEVNIAVPETLVLEPGAAPPFERTPHATTTSLTVLGEQCRLVQLVPNAFVVRMTRALDENAPEHVPVAVEGSGFSMDALRDVRVRVSAELGRATLPLGDLVGLPEGAVVELDRDADDPLDLFVNGRRFASGRLVLVDDEWAVRLEEILEPAELAATVEGGTD